MTRAIATVHAVVLQPITALAFWSAIVLPFLYIPLLLVGVDTTAELVAVFALVGLNVVTAVLGHRHGND